MTTLPTVPGQGSARYKQRAATAVQSHLLMYDLPKVWAWTIRDDGLNAQMFQSFDDATTMANLHEWAVLLGGDDGAWHIHTEPWKNKPDRMRIWVEGERDGVPVEVWSEVATPSVVAAETGGAA